MGPNPSRGDVMGDRQFRLAALNLLEDAEQARQAQSVEARERARAETEILASEERYRSLFTLMDQGFGIAEVEVDAQGVPIDLRWLEVNPRFSELTGLSRERLLEGTVRDLSPALEAGWTKMLGKVARSGESVRFEQRSEALDRWFDVHAFRFGTADQRRVAVLFSNITDRVRRGSHLAFLSDVLSAIVDLNTVADIERAVVERVQRHLDAERVLVIEVAAGDDAIPGATRRSRIPRASEVPEIALKPQIEEALRRRRPVIHSTFVAATEDVAIDSPAYVMQPLGRVGAGLRGLLIRARGAREWRPDEIDLLQDVAARIGPRLESAEADAVLRDNELLLRLILDNARDYAILSLDLDRRITSWNSGAEAVIGYTAGEALGQSADLIFTEEDRIAGAPAREAGTALTTGRAMDERWHVRKDGTRFWGSGVMMAMRGSEGPPTGLLKIFRDQTDELMAKEALEKSRIRLLAALEEAEVARAEAESAGQAKDRFFAMLSHELRTPLTPILLMTELLRQRDDLPSDVHDGLAMIRRNVELEARFVDDLLDVTKIARGVLKVAREPLALHDAIAQGIALSLPDLEARGQRLHVDLAATAHRVTGDLARLQQVVWNLLKNAAKFTPRGGSIALRTFNPSPDLVALEVSDTGIGIEPSVMPYIFEAFRQADPSITRRFGGLGLGLAIVQATVRSHHGEIVAHSDGADTGATFTVTLPLSDSGDRPGLAPEAA